MPLTDDQKAEIATVREGRHATRRATVPAIDDLLYQPIPVLDHGFVRVIDYMGDDGAVVQAARVSYGRGTRRASDDRGLIRYLMRHRHTTPFEMCEIKLHVKLPIFVARQWIRHRTANVNEYSARYSILDREFYLPAPDHMAAQSAANRQGRAEALPEPDAAEALRRIREGSMRAYDDYEALLNEAPEGGTAEGRSADPVRTGLARELARMVLPTNYYTQWYWKIDLHNLLHFVSLRGDPHAQYEIRAYAETIAGIAAKWVPLTWEAFQDYRVHGVQLSAAALAVVRRRLAGETVSQAESGLTPREWRELEAALEGRSGGA